MKVGIVIQAHMGSTRLPGKVMLPLAGKPVLWHDVERCKQTKLADAVIVATSVEPADDVIVTFCKENNIACFRGSDADVLSRFVGAADAFGLDAVMRVTSDCPLIEPEVIDQVIARFLEGGYDYAANYINYENLSPRPARVPAFPHGFEIEMFSTASLKRAVSESSDPWQHEHLTYVWQNADGSFKLAPTVVASPEYQKDFRLTLDYPEDYALFEKMYAMFYREGSIVNVHEVFSYLEAHPEVAALNESRKQK
jgi:spore coat polysaccharide biosynthesis protein SpsF